jgi:uncharacterized protein (TIGR03435 family)
MCLVSVLMTRAPAQEVRPLTFEVASVKSASPNQNAVDFVVSPGGRLRITNLTLAEMIREAYQFKYYQVSGGPAWLDTDRFNVEAKPAGQPARNEVMAMLQALLVERFQLKVRRETRQGSVYELLVASRGPKLKPSTADNSFLRLNRNTPPDLQGVSYTIVGQKVSMAKLADDLMGYLQRPVVDRTGISGEFDFKIDYAIEGHSETGPSIFTALQDQLGLRLRTAKGPVQNLVVQKAERPTEN